MRRRAAASSGSALGSAGFSLAVPSAPSSRLRSATRSEGALSWVPRSAAHCLIVLPLAITKPAVPLRYCSGYCFPGTWPAAMPGPFLEVVY